MEQQIDFQWVLDDTPPEFTGNYLALPYNSKTPFPVSYSAGMNEWFIIDSDGFHVLRVECWLNTPLEEIYTTYKHNDFMKCKDCLLFDKCPSGQRVVRHIPNFMRFCPIGITRKEKDHG